jgi:hypothetical protein
MMYRMQNFVRQPERTISKRLMEKVVRRGYRSYQRVLDRQAPGIGPTFAHCGHYILHFTTRQGLEVWPTPARGGFAERSVRALNCYTHEHAPG